MKKRPFFILDKRSLDYEPLTVPPSRPIDVPVPKRVTLLCNRPYDPYQPQLPILIRAGDEVQTGQKVTVYNDPESYVISTITGKISAISVFTDDCGQNHTAVAIEGSGEEILDARFKDHSTACSLDTAGAFLAHLPGRPVFEVFSDSEKPLHTLVVCGADRDLWVDTNQYIVISRLTMLKKGIEILKQISGIDQVVLALPRDLVSGFESMNADIRTLSTAYPSAFPRMIMKDIFRKIVPADKNPEDLGVSFFSAEGVAAIGRAFTDGQLPITKLLTVIRKDGRRSIVSARIGTSIGDIFRACDIVVNDGDRIVVGGPMTGSAVFSENHPIQPDTDAILVQEKSGMAMISDDPCINCGECVRICPAKIQVNMLVRVLEAGKFDVAADQYDLDCCIECGLCSFVCVSNMPIFQYIRLAKKELARINLSEAIS